MVARQCEHCQRLNDQYGGQERDDESPGHGNTLGHQQQAQQSSSGSEVEDDEKPKDGGEKGGAEGPPAPVGISDKKLSRLRLEVLGLWARTS